MSTDTAARKSDRAERVIDHLSPAERMAVGRRAREAVPRGITWNVREPWPDWPDPVELLEISKPRPGYPTWFRSATGGCSPRRSVLPRGPAVMSSTSPALLGPALTCSLWGRPSPQLRRLRGARTPARVQRQRLRRVAAGALRVGPQATLANLSSPARAVGLSPAEREVLNLAVARSYREAMAGFAHMRALDVWYARLDADQFRREWDAGADQGREEALRKGAGEITHQGACCMNPRVGGPPLGGDGGG